MDAYVASANKILILNRSVMAPGLSVLDSRFTTIAI